MADIQINLQKWIHQPTTSSGFQIPFEFGVDIQTTLYPQVVIGAFGSWRVIDTMSNVYHFPRAKRFTSDDIKTNRVLGQAMNLEYLSGEYDNVNLTHQLSIGKVMQNFEIESSGADYVRFFIEEAIMQLARTYEDYCIDDLTDLGTSGADFIVTDSTTGKKDLYETLLNLRTQLVKQGSMLQNVDLYVTPEIVAEIMKDKHYIANGIGQIPATEVRNGFMGRILGFNIYEAPRLSLHTFATGKECSILAVDNSQVIRVRHMVQPIQIERAPSDFLAECSILKSLEYFKNYLVNSNGCYYINF